MGGLFSKSDKTNEEIINDIEELNKITNNELFYKKTGFKLNFVKSNHFFKSILGGKTVVVQIQVYNQGLFPYVEEKFINLSYFYKISNAVLNSLPIFYQEKIISRTLKSESPKDSEENVCPICEDKKITTMLDCYHFFCNDCISTWLIRKRNNCPICRYEIDLKDYQEKRKKNHQWDIVELDNNDYLNEMSNILKETIKGLSDY